MTNVSTTTTTDAQHDPALCPSWCQGRHLTTGPDDMAGGFHHDSQPMSTSEDNETGSLHVNVAQYVPAGDAPWRVEIEVQDDAVTLASITPTVARELATLLTDAADLAEGKTRSLSDVPTARLLEALSTFESKWLIEAAAAGAAALEELARRMAAKGATVDAEEFRAHVYSVRQDVEVAREELLGEMLEDV